MDEIDKIKLHYKERETDDLVIKNSANTLYSQYISKEREQQYSTIIRNHFKHIEQLKMLEIGAGGGANIPFFSQLGFPNTNIYANELLDNRMSNLKENFPDITHFPGNALDIKANEKFDIVFQSTVFTSILDDGFKQQLANKIVNMLTPNGIVLWYDFVYDNPKNKAVKGIRKNEIIKLFPEAKKITFHKVTLAPPIGRRVGKLYPFFNALSFLRSHTIAKIEK